MQKKTSLVLWDWNGTLLDDLALCVDSLNWLLREFGYPQQYSTPAYKKIFGFPIVEYYRRAGFDFEKHSFDRLAHHYMDHYIPASMGCGLAPFARQALEQVRALGVEQVVLSASPISTLTRQVEQTGSGKYFSTLLGLGDIYAKSKVELGLDFLARRGFEPSSALMVGDTLHDWEVARAMGVRCVLCAAGHQDWETLSAAGVPVIRDLSGLAGLL